jgi:hypothetical protein
MSIVLIILYLPLIALLGFLVVGRDWPRSWKFAALAALLLALPVYFILMWAGETREAFLFGLGLIAVTIVPANLLALALGGWLASVRKRRQ